MFGKIINFDNSRIMIENLKGIADTNYIGFHVVFPDQDHKIVGEIVSIDTNKITIMLVGEINNQNKFTSGVLKKPSINSTARLIYKEELETVLGNQNFQDKNTILFGSSPIYKNFYITSDLNEFFSNHFAILGNTGSGKSCGLARLIQNIFYSSGSNIPKNAHICLFDAYGEYYNTFDAMNNIEGLHSKKYTTQIGFENNDLISIPAYLLDVDDLAILLGATSTNQIYILRRTINLARIFNSNDPKAIDFKNDIIANCILDILSSGKKSNQMRDQIISVLTAYNTETLNLNSPITQPGYNRTLRQCLNIDDQGKMNAMNVVVDFFQKFKKIDIDRIELDSTTQYSLNDLYYALEFALINEGALLSDKIYEENNLLKSHLHSIINSELVNMFDSSIVTTKADYVENFFRVTRSNEYCQLIDINLSYLDDKFAKAITKIFSKLFFEYTTNLERRGSFPIHLILEEAHRYVQNDSDVEIIGYNIFDRITKEGRKYGTILGFITQRPNELSKTALSQCSNFIVFKLFYPEDLNIVANMSSNVTAETIEQIKTLHPGMSLVFGSAFKIPLLVNFPLPNPLPISTSLKLDNIWYE